MLKKSFTFSGCFLTKEKIIKIQKEIKHTSFMMGYSLISVTPNGGVHFSGVQKKTKAISFEVPISQSYIVILIYTYPKGIIIHLFEPINNNKKIKEEKIEEILKKLFIILKDKKEENENEF